MLPYRTALRQTPLACRSLRSIPAVAAARQWPRFASSGEGNRRGGIVGKLLGGLVVAVAAGGAYALYPIYTREPPKPTAATVKFEKTRPEPASKEDNRDQISSQHLQVKNSWENPGVYIWGSNSGKVVAPESNEPVVKTPRRLAYFDGQLLRDLKVDREFGAAITENGDLVQWGSGFSAAHPTPVTTLKGKDLAKIDISRDRIIALAKNGSVYSIPVSSSDQTSDKPQQSSSSWLSFWSKPANQPSYRQLKPDGLSWGETITDIASGMEHALLLTSKGRLFSAAASTSDFPSKGQLGIPGLAWETRPQGPFDQPHEINMLKGHKIKKIAAGDYHSLALEDKGRVYVFGDNSSGQLGFEPENAIPFVDGPIPLPFSKIYSGSNQQPSVTSIAAGGSNSFFTVDATRTAGPSNGEQDKAQGTSHDVGRVTADTWACGSGITGSLGTGKWTHVSLGPSKIKPLSALFEWDEKTNSVTPIRLSRLSVGSTHAAAVVGNATQVLPSGSGSKNDTNYGADVLFWGGNEHYQLGTGKRNNIAVPSYISPLDGGRGDAEKGRKGEEHRFQISPRATARIGKEGKGRKVSMEQRVECGRHVTAVYSAT
ncbi:hypothetical protein SLS62_000352 [Diatrype stigma]|uniref:Uncharacterized protein n=1 Tax=Diatrype stigma TaxID=117547 RepID=A0AAN9YXE9_9PEZI